MHKFTPKKLKAGLNPRANVLAPLQNTVARKANLHTGFRDLNPVYSKIRRDKTKATADQWLDAIKMNLRKRVYDEKRKMFNDELMLTKNQDRLTYTKIKNLSNTYRKDLSGIVNVKYKKLTGKVMNALGDMTPPCGDCAPHPPSCSRYPRA